MESYSRELKEGFPIIQIVVKDLFGHYTYSIPKEPVPQSLASFVIMYGDNGSGKTSILRLLFWLLATHQTRGYKSNIARTPFRLFRVELLNGISIVAERTGARLQGAFVMRVTRGGAELASTVFDTDSNYSVPAEVYRRPTTVKLLEVIRQLDLSIYFLSDDRQIHLGAESEYVESEEGYVEFLDSDTGSFVRQRSHGRPIAPTQRALKRAEDWLLKQAIFDSNQGEENANLTYATILTNLAESPMAKEEDMPPVEKLCAILLSLEERTASFSRFGLLPPLETAGVREALMKTEPERRLVVFKVLKPYIDVARERLNARQEIQTLVAAFVDDINSFLKDKEVKFTLQEGFKICAHGSEELSAEQLSSGEKQLLMLLCNTLAARSGSTIFLIDEPELSLNVKWQRLLIPALSNCTKGSNVQFFLASHSLQMLAQHRTHIVKLTQEADE